MTQPTPREELIQSAMASYDALHEDNEKNGTISIFEEWITKVVDIVIAAVRSGLPEEENTDAFMNDPFHIVGIFKKGQNAAIAAVNKSLDDLSV